MQYQNRKLTPCLVIIRRINKKSIYWMLNPTNDLDDPEPEIAGVITSDQVAAHSRYLFNQDTHILYLGKYYRITTDITNVHECLILDSTDYNVRHRTEIVGTNEI